MNFKGTGLSTLLVGAIAVGIASTMASSGAYAADPPTAPPASESERDDDDDDGFGDDFGDDFGDGFDDDFGDNGFGNCICFDDRLICFGDEEDSFGGFGASCFCFDDRIVCFDNGVFDPFDGQLRVTQAAFFLTANRLLVTGFAEPRALVTVHWGGRNGRVAGVDRANAVGRFRVSKPGVLLIDDMVTVEARRGVNVDVVLRVPLQLGP